MASKKGNGSDRVYNLLAPTCLVVGVFVPIIIQNIWAIGSGIFWLSAGSLAIWQQRGHRKANGPTLDQESQANSRANQLVWSKKFECGNSFIDAQHQQIFNGFNALSNAIHCNRSKQYVDVLVDTLIADVKAHFRSEEALLTNWNHPLTEKQRALHEVLLNKATRLRHKLRSGMLSHQDFLDFVINEVVYGHIDLEDRSYFFEI